MRAYKTPVPIFQRGDTKCTLFGSIISSHPFGRNIVGVKVTITLLRAELQFEEKKIHV